MDEMTIGKIVELSAAGKTLPHPQGGEVVLVPRDFQVHHLEKAYTPAPYITATPTLRDANSFITYVNEYKNAGTHIFADLASNQLTACLDYHKPGSAEPNRHVARLKLDFSAEWKAWDSRMSQGQIPQVAFAEFIEEQAFLIRTPPGAELLEMVTNLQSHTTVEFASKVDIRTGKVQLTYNEVEKANAGIGKLSVPQKLEVALAVFEGEPRDPFEVYLRTRIKDGKLNFIIKIDQAPEKVRAAFYALTKRISEETSLNVLAGAPDTSSRY